MPVITEKSRISLPDTYDYTLNEPNICVLDVATWQIDEQPAQPLTEIMKIDQAVRKHFDLRPRGGEMVQPWYAEKTDGVNYQKPLGVLKMQFPFDVAVMPSDTLFLCLETPDRFTAVINGRKLSMEQSAGWFIDNSIHKFAVPTNYLQQGRNTVELIANFSRNLDLEALYLIGDFGVELKGIQRTLTKLPAKLKVGDIATQGLPFYSGPFATMVGNLPEPAAGERVMLQMPGFDGRLHRTEQRLCAPDLRMAPYKKDVTRWPKKRRCSAVERGAYAPQHIRPAHALPARAGAYGPWNWRTEGGSFTMDQYTLLPAGLTQQPTLVIDDVK